MTKGLNWVLGSNIVYLAIGALILVGLPKIVSPVAYGNWQLYQLYATYFGYLTFGYTDGVYLRFGGEKYENLPRRSLSAGLWYQLIANTLCIGIVYGLASAMSSNHVRFLVIAAISSVFYISRTLITVMMQITGHSRDFAVATLIERVTLLVGLGTLLLMGYHEVDLLIWADVAGKAAGLACALFLARKVFCSRPLFDWATLKQYISDCRAGMYVLVANLSAILINGVIRLAIEHGWGVVAFGQVSLAFQLLTFVLVFINSVSLSIFPNLKRLPQTEYSQAYSQLRARFVTPLVLALGLYFPLAWLLTVWLPDYSSSARYLAILFPLCIYETTSRGLVGVFLKALRYERILMVVNLCGLGLACALAAVSVWWLKDINAAVLSIVVALGARAVLSEWFLSRRISIKIWRNACTELALAIIFLVVALAVPHSTWAIVAVYASLAIYGVYNRKKLIFIHHRDNKE